MVFNELVKRASKFAADNAPTLLTGIAVTGTLTTAYLAGRGAYKAAQLLGEEPAFLTPKEKFEQTYRFYIPAAASAVVTVTAIIASQQIGHRRAIAMAAALAVSEKAYEEYREKVREKFGERKERTVRDEIAQDRVRNNPSNEVIVASNESLYMDGHTGRYFKSDMETVRRAVNEINHRINSDFYASLSDFYRLIGLSPTSHSDELGWNSNRLLELSYSAVIAEDNRPCIVIDFRTVPSRNYYKVG